MDSQVSRRHVTRHLAKTTSATSRARSTVAGVSSNQKAGQSHKSILFHGRFWLRIRLQHGTGDSTGDVATSDDRRPDEASQQHVGHSGTEL